MKALWYQGDESILEDKGTPNRYTDMVENAEE